MIFEPGSGFEGGLTDQVEGTISLLMDMGIEKLIGMGGEVAMEGENEMERCQCILRPTKSIGAKNSGCMRFKSIVFSACGFME